MTVTNSNNIAAADYNSIYAILEDHLGLGDNGWGLPLLSSSPTIPFRKAGAYEYNNLLKDINIAHTHITNATTSTGYIGQGTTVISAALFNQLLNTSNWLHDSSRRWTSHPDQYFKANKATGGTGTDMVPLSASSERTLAWGANGISSIYHEATAVFRSPSAARYYFNQGNFLSFLPYYSGTGINDLDAEWANFIDSIRADPFIYNRTDFIAGDKEKLWENAGTLYIRVKADRSLDQSVIDFTVTFGNTANPNLLITPAVGTYKVIIPSGLLASYGRTINPLMFGEDRISLRRTMPGLSAKHQNIKYGSSHVRSSLTNIKITESFDLKSKNIINKSTGI